MAYRVLQYSGPRPAVVSRSERSLELARALAGWPCEVVGNKPVQRPGETEIGDPPRLQPSHFCVPKNKPIVVMIDGEQQLEAVGELANFMQPSPDPRLSPLAVYVFLFQASRQRLEEAMRVPEWVRFVEVPIIDEEEPTVASSTIAAAIVGQSAIWASQGTFSHFIIVSSGKFAVSLQHLLRNQQWGRSAMTIEADVVTSQGLFKLIASALVFPG